MFPLRFYLKLGVLSSNGPNRRGLQTHTQYTKEDPRPRDPHRRDPRPRDPGESWSVRSGRVDPEHV